MGQQILQRSQVIVFSPKTATQELADVKNKLPPAEFNKAVRTVMDYADSYGSLKGKDGLLVEMTASSDKNLAGYARENGHDITAMAHYENRLYSNQRIEGSARLMKVYNEEYNKAVERNENPNKGQAAQHNEDLKTNLKQLSASDVRALIEMEDKGMPRATELLNKLVELETTKKGTLAQEVKEMLIHPAPAPAAAEQQELGAGTAAAMLRHKQLLEQSGK